MRNNILETSRLRLEPLDLNHVTDNYVEWLNDRAVYKYLETRGGQTLKSVKEYVINLKNQKAYSWAILFKENKKHIGNIKIHPISTTHFHGEYGILIGDKNYWGMGIAREASLEVIHYMFTNDILQRITLGVIKENQAALKLYRKIGFEQEGIYRNHVKYGKEYHNVIRMAILKSDFHE